jgi:hypothetical protein
MNQVGGSMYVPHAFTADGNIITVFDPSPHQIDDSDDAYDDGDATVAR